MTTTIPVTSTSKFKRYKFAAEGSTGNVDRQFRNCRNASTDRNPQTATAARSKPQRNASRYDAPEERGVSVRAIESNVQVLDVEGVFLDELAAGLDVFAH